MSEIPRRNDVRRNNATEIMIRQAIDYVERLGADERLTDAVVSLGEALESVADYVDGAPRRQSSYARGVSAERERCAKICEGVRDGSGWTDDAMEAIDECARLIRAEDKEKRS